MKIKKNNLTSLDEIIEKEYGAKGTNKRDKFEEGYREFKTKKQILQGTNKNIYTQNSK